MKFSEWLINNNIHTHELTVRELHDVIEQLEHATSSKVVDIQLCKNSTKIELSNGVSVRVPQFNYCMNSSDVHGTKYRLVNVPFHDDSEDLDTYFCSDYFAEFYSALKAKLEMMSQAFRDDIFDHTIVIVKIN